jgi:hypothetical protein
MTFAPARAEAIVPGAAPPHFKISLISASGAGRRERSLEHARCRRSGFGHVSRTNRRIASMRGGQAARLSPLRTVWFARILA